MSTPQAPGGWGAGGWGSTPWGFGIVPLKLLRADPVRENVVRLTFNTTVFFTGLLGPNDASNIERYVVTPVAGTLPGGLDPRSVSPAEVNVAVVVGSQGSILDLTVDRGFSPFPAQYSIAVNQLQSASGGLLVPGMTSATFDGLKAFRAPPTRDRAVPIRDIANPQTRSALFDPLPVTDDPGVLGSIPVDENGDYAFDEGITNLKKRIFRRVVTSKGRFSHLPDYGVGLPDQLKRLNRASTRAELASETERQVSQEPDVEQVSVVVVNDSRRPGLFRLRMRVVAKVSDDPINMDIPFEPTAS